MKEEPLGWRVIDGRMYPPNLAYYEQIKEKEGIDILAVACAASAEYENEEQSVAEAIAKAIESNLTE